MAFTIEIEENQTNQKVNLLRLVSSKADGVKKQLNCSFTRSWKFWVCLVGFVLLIGLVFGLWADVKGHVLEVHDSVSQDVQGHVAEVKTHVAEVRSNLLDHAEKFDDQLTTIHEKMGNDSEILTKVKEESKSLSRKLADMTTHLPVNCNEVVERGTEASGAYTIDPDGKGHGVEPFSVHCDFETYWAVEEISGDYFYLPKKLGIAVVSLDESLPIVVEGRSTFRKDFQYTGVSIDQLRALAESSDTCEQSIRFDCHMAKLSGFGTWIDRNDNEQTYFTGSRSGEAICECATTEPNTCAASGSEAKCNCDQMYPTWREDSGVLTDKSALPIKGFQYNHLDKWTRGNENATIAIGSLKCKGRSNKGQALEPRTCKDFKKAGQLSGHYVVSKSEDEVEIDPRSHTKVIKCDMTVAEDSPNFEVNIGDILTKREVSIELVQTRFIPFPKDSENGVDIRFDKVVVKPSTLSSIVVGVDNTVINVPWKGKYAIQSVNVGNYYKMMVSNSSSVSWKEIKLSEVRWTFVTNRGHVMLEKGDKVKVVLVSDAEQQYCSLSDKCAITLTGVNFDI